MILRQPTLSARLLKSRAYPWSYKECKMDCHQAREGISAYLDQELDATSSRQVESHLHNCAKCRRVFAKYREIDGMVRGLPQVDLGPDFARQMRMKLIEPTVIGKIERRGGSSLLERLLRPLEEFLDLVITSRSRTTGTLDEFSDFPPLSMGHIYFELMDRRTQC